jgi:hypothetical protein
MIVVDHGRQVPRRSVGLARGAADAGPSHGLAVHCDRTPTLIDGQSRVDPGAQGQVEAVAVEASQHPPDRGLARRAASQPCPHCYLRGSACRRIDHLWVDVRPRRQAGRLSSGPALDLRPALGPARRGHQDTALAASAGHASPLRRRAPAAQDRPSRRARLTCVRHRERHRDGRAQRPALVPASRRVRRARSEGVDPARAAAQLRLVAVGVRLPAGADLAARRAQRDGRHRSPCTGSSSNRCSTKAPQRWMICSHSRRLVTQRPPRPDKKEARTSVRADHQGWS